jgi:hypothetical protein
LWPSTTNSSGQVFKAAKAVAAAAYKLSEQGDIAFSCVLFAWFFYRKYCHPTIRVLGVNMYNAQSSPWVKVPVSLHEGLDSILVELVCSMFIICIDLLVKCIDHVHAL